MSESRAKTNDKAIARQTAAPAPPAADFEEVLELIQTARARTVAEANTALIDLYWAIGRHISRRVSDDGWGQGTVQTLAGYIRRRLPNARGFSAQNLWCMRQFFETYRDRPKLSPLVRESGKLEFYLEALDRDVKKPHENPAVGILLCATKGMDI